MAGDAEDTTSLPNSSFEIHVKQGNQQRLKGKSYTSFAGLFSRNTCAEIKVACEQALIFVVIIDVARAAKPRVTSRRGVWHEK